MRLGEWNEFLEDLGWVNLTLGESLMPSFGGQITPKF